MLPCMNLWACQGHQPHHSVHVQVLLHALRDFNLGKLIADDTSIFTGLLNDLFPKTAELVPRHIDHDFESKVSAAPAPCGIAGTCRQCPHCPVSRSHYPRQTARMRRSGRPPSSWGTSQTKNSASKSASCARSWSCAGACSCWVPLGAARAPSGARSCERSSCSARRRSTNPSTPRSACALLQRVHSRHCKPQPADEGARVRSPSRATSCTAALTRPHANGARGSSASPSATWPTTAPTSTSGLCWTATLMPSGSRSGLHHFAAHA